MAAVKNELEDQIIGARIDRVYQPLSRTILINLRKNKEQFKLLLSAHPVDARVHLTTAEFSNPSTPPLFCMVLRKHLEGGSIKEVKQQGLERILKFKVSTLDELSRPQTRELICEVMGKHSNIILLNPETGKIIDAVKRVTHAVNRFREILPGKAYIEPPHQDKFNLLETDEERFTNIIMSSPLYQSLPQILQQNFTGLSSQTAREIVYRAGLENDLPLNLCGEYELTCLWQSFKTISQNIRESNFLPTLTEENGNIVAYSAFDLQQYQGLLKAHEKSMSKVIDTFYRRKAANEKFSSKKSKLACYIKKELKKAYKKLDLQQQKMAEAGNAVKYRLFGELVTANIYRIKRGDYELITTNYLDPQGKEISIPLVPHLTPSQNAQKYFKKYNKAKKTLEKTEREIQKTRREIEYLESLDFSLEEAKDLREIGLLEEELAKTGYIPKASLAKERKAPTSVQPQEKPRLFYDGSFKILVGRNNTQNDRLTLHQAHKEDIWFHVKDMPGSHVILKTEGKGEIPLKTLKKAASLAAYYSKARESANVPVDYTLVKHVRKPRGARPGMVIYDNYRTLYVNPGKAAEKIEG